MSGPPVDPLARLSEALSAPADSKDQATTLASLREQLEGQPQVIPILCRTLLPAIANSGDSLMRRWVLELLHYGLCVSALPPETKTGLAAAALDTLTKFLNERTVGTVKVVVQCFAGVYPLLFRAWITDRSQSYQWDILSRAKATIVEFVSSLNVPIGVKEAAIKFIQRVVVVQTRGVQDPRLQSKNDPNVAMVPADHPFISSQALEQEGSVLLQKLMTIVYQNPNTDLVTSVLNSWTALAKNRPASTQIIIPALCSWTPMSLVGQPAFNVRSVEKNVRILLVHLSRLPHAASFIPQIRDALAVQEQRMDKAMREEKERKAATRTGLKRPSSALEHVALEAKRLKTEHGAVTPTGAASATAAVNPLAQLDFSALAPTLVTELIVANLHAFSEQALQGLVQAYRSKLGQTTQAAAPLASTSTLTPAGGPLQPPTEPAANVKSEPIDPLQMDMDDDEMEYEPDRLNNELLPNTGANTVEDALEKPTDLPLQLAEFTMPAPRPLTDEEQDGLLETTLARIRTSAEDGQDEASVLQDMSMLLFVRIVTRGLSPPPHARDENLSQDRSGDVDMEGNDEKMKVGDQDLKVEDRMYQDELRQRLCDYITSDFSARVRLASIWMNEEWYNDRIRKQSDPDWHENYGTWLNQLVLTYQAHMDPKDRSFPQFLTNLPAVPSDVLDLLRDWCTDREKTHAGFNSLRDFVSHRPPLRAAAMKTLLELTTHEEGITRRPAINTVKQWVPDVQPMAGMVRRFALQLLRRLRKRRSADERKVSEGEAGIEGNSDEEDGQLPQEELVKTEYLSDELDLPANKSQILQHVELVFALCSKVPDYLDDIFSTYIDMDPSVQAVIQELITPLIKSLGSNNGKLLTLMRTFPAGSESLALRVLKIFTEHGRPSLTLVSLVKGLITDRNLDARFLIPIIAEMDKADITRHLPRIAGLLTGVSKQEDKTLVRSVFEAIVTTPPQTFGSVTSNLPRVRQSELLTPAELMVLLHDAEKDIGLKATIEAIGICFSMTDVFRSEILAVVMQQIVDEPVLPVLFMRTVIQAVTTYKSLVGFVSTTLLSRLITKKIWTNPPLWEGFIRCAKVIAPASFPSLLQLPKEQLRDLVDKQPSLKAGLREYVLKKAGNKARVSGFLDIFGEDTPAPEEGALNVPQPQPVPAA